MWLRSWKDGGGGHSSATQNSRGRGLKRTRVRDAESRPSRLLGVFLLIFKNYPIANGTLHLGTEHRQNGIIRSGLRDSCIWGGFRHENTAQSFHIHDLISSCGQWQWKGTKDINYSAPALKVSFQAGFSDDSCYLILFYSFIYLSLFQTAELPFSPHAFQGTATQILTCIHQLWVFPRVLPHRVYLEFQKFNT